MKKRKRSIVQADTSYNEERYLANLKNLPELPFDSE
jgi:hypothetical protein